MEYEKPESKFCTTKKERQIRLDICETCEHQNKTIKACTQCACILPWKTWFLKASCPIGKW